jgi:hypothetical protein
MTAPFEDPAKTEMRARCEIAIDQSGYDLVDTPSAVELPVNVVLSGRLKGDLQSLDGDGARYCYYLRPGAGDTLPKWLANLAGAAHQLAAVKLYVVVDHASPGFEKACKAAGAGLVVINEANEFVHILDFASTLPEAIDKAFEDRVNELRRKLEAKFDLNQTTLKARFEQIGDLTRGMDDELADKYSDSVERQYGIWTAWSEAMSSRLDSAYAAREVGALDDIESEIATGPLLDDAV